MDREESPQYNFSTRIGALSDKPKVKQKSEVAKHSSTTNHMIKVYETPVLQSATSTMIERR